MRGTFVCNILFQFFETTPKFENEEDMDLWSRLIGGVDAAHVAQTSSPSEQRLARLKQIDNDLAVR